MLHDDSLLAEAQRQFMICSACRYCEGFCATFPAIESRLEYSAADTAYIANLCHDCRACHQACMYTDPHPFAVDIPTLLTDVRVASYEERRVPAGWPAASAAMSLTIAVAAGSALLASIAATGRWQHFRAADTGPGAFYHVVPFGWMLVPALLLALAAAGAVVAPARNLVRDVLPAAPLRVSDWLGAWKDGLTLAYMHGGGAGCYSADADRPSSARRTLHVILVAGVTLDGAATAAAAIMQDVLRIQPPFALWSVPVVLGTLGGIGILAGAGGLLVRKARTAQRRGAVRAMIAMDTLFLIVLLIVALTGLALLAFRATAALGPLLVVHLSCVAALFVTAPYGKFVHVPLRLAALAIFRFEEA